LSQKEFVKPVDLENPYRLFNLGGTVFLEVKEGDDIDVMPASWACPADYTKMSVVVDSTHYSRKILDKAEYFLLTVPGYGIRKELLYLGSVSKNGNPNKIQDSGLKFFNIEGCDFPLPEGCAAWALIKRIPEAHMEKSYDMFVGEIVKAWADSRVFSDNHWHLEKGPEELRSLHYVAGGHFYEIGKSVEVTL